MVDGLGFGKEGGLGASVDGAAGGKDKVVDAVVATEIEERERSPHVGVYVDKGILNGGSNSRTRCHVTDPCGLLVLKDVVQKRGVADVSPIDRDVWMLVGEQLEIGLLERDVVVVVDFVQNHDRISPLQEVVCDVTANKSSSTRH